MRSTAQPIEDNKVKLSIEVDEAEMEGALQRTYRRMAKEVRFPGFRPGKVPRQLLEARLGSDTLRNEALSDALPEFYAKALVDSEIDAIAAPEIEITDGKESGPVVFDAVVEVRPVITVPGYEGLEVTIPNPKVSPEEIDAGIDRMRRHMGHLDEVDRPAKENDQVKIDLVGSRDGKDLAALTASGLDYVVGAGDLVPGLDEAITGAKAGEERTFEAVAPDGEQASFKVKVHTVSENVLPEADDAWAKDTSEFSTVAELRADIETRMEQYKRAQAPMVLREATVAALVALVETEPPAVLVDSEVSDRLNELGRRLDAQRVSLEQYMSLTGLDQEGIVAQARNGAAEAVQADLALRAVASAENLEVTEEDLDEEITSSARAGERPERLRQRLEQAGRLSALRSELRKAKALDWLLEHVSVVDEEGQAIDRALLVTPDATQAGTVEEIPEASVSSEDDKSDESSPA